MDYPAGYNPALRIRLDQIKRVKCDGGQSTNTLRIDLRDASYVSDGVDRLGLIDYNPGTDEVDYTQVYLVDTDDPQYERFFANTTPENFNEFMLPIGKLSALVGEEYEVGEALTTMPTLGSSWMNSNWRMGLRSPFPHVKGTIILLSCISRKRPVVERPRPVVGARSR